MILAYLDESSTDNWYYMAALLCDGHGVQAISSALDEAAHWAVKEHGAAEGAELHGYELYQGTGWWTGVPVRVRIGVYSRVFKAIGKHSQAIILRGVNSAGLRRRYSPPKLPHSVVLMHLFEQINKYAATHDDFALVIADEVGEPARHRADLAAYRQDGTWGYRATKLTQIIDTLHFAPSDTSRLLQAADLVVYLHRRMVTHTEPSDKARRANERLWSHVEPKVVHQWCWHP